jgi:carbonic anhydrase/acetyltransferase-like protein (isoleucine patch superfamily)
MILPFREQHPRLGAGVWIAATARVIGDVELGDDVNVWFGAVVRGDVFPIRIGRGTNIQDNAVIHVTTDRHATEIGEGVTIGHGATLHGCRVGDRALIGIGAIVLDQAVIGEEAMIGAGALVSPGMVIPPRTLAIGSPARVKRDLTAEELGFLRYSGPHYVEIAREYARIGA